MKLRFEQINYAALSSCPSLLEGWLPGGRLNGREYKCGDITGGPGNSFSVNTDTGVWKEFNGDGEGGNDLISLYARQNNLSQGQAAKCVAREVGVEAHTAPRPRPNRRKKNHTQNWTPIAPIPEDAPRPSLKHPQKGEPSASWMYRDEHGGVLGFVCRFNKAGGGKDILPHAYCRGPEGQKQWCWKGFSTPSPLYGLDRLAKHPNAPVLIVEGEKAADAAQSRCGDRVVVVTWPGGCGALNKANLTVLNGRRVTMWPDNDEPGIKAMLEIANKAEAAGFIVEGIVEPDPDWLPKTDIADFPQWTQQDFFRVLKDRTKTIDVFLKDYGVADPNKWPEIAPFDSMNLTNIGQEFLPSGSMGDFLSSLSDSIQTPFELGLISALGAVATAVQGKIQIAPKGLDDDYREPLNLYALTALPPGERKSAVVSACKKPLVEWEKEQREQLKPAIDQAQELHRLTEKRIDGLRNQYVKGDGDPSILAQINEANKQLEEIPVLPQLFTDDVTPEGLALLLSKQGERISIIEAEGGLFETLAGRYSNGVPNIDIVLKGWSGEPVTIDRRGSTNIRLEQPLMTMCLSVQPSVIAELGKKPGFRDRGMVARFFFCFPKSRVGWRSTTTNKIPQAHKDGYRDLLRRLLFLSAEVQDVSLSHEASKAWEEFCEAVEVELRDGGDFDGMKDVGSKLTGQVVRLAGLLHVAHAEDPYGPIKGQTMEQAINLAAALADHSRAALTRMAIKPEVEKAMHILRWIKANQFRKGTLRDIHQGLRRTYEKVEDMKPGVNELASRGFLRQESVRSNSIKIVVNPAAFEG